MKKIISFVLTAVFMLSVCVSAFAEERKAPAYSADKSLINRVSDGFWTNSLRSHSREADHDYGEKLTDTYKGKKIVWGKAGENEISASTVDIFLDYGMGKVGFGGKPITLNGALNTEDSIYVVIFGYEVAPAYTGTVKSFLLSVPGDDTLWGACAPDGFTLFTSDTAWNETETYSKTFSKPTTTEFTEVVRVENLNKGNKWVNDPSGKFKYYEADFDTEISEKYFVMAFTIDDFASIKEAAASKKIGSAIYAPTEFAVFGEKLSGPAATEAPKATEAPSVTEAPKATEVPDSSETPNETTSPESTEQAPTDAPEATDEAKATDSPEATDEAKATEAPDVTEAPKATEGSSEDGNNEKKGCGSLTSAGLAVLCLAALSVTKKKED